MSSQFSWQEQGPTEKTADKAPCLVFIHGIGGGADTFSLQLDHFSPHYRVVAWDMPGYGRSKPLEKMTFPALNEALLQFIKDDLQEEKVHLIGHSLGGMVAQDFALTHAEYLASVTLYATSAVFGSRDGSFQKEFLKARLGPLDDGLTMPELAQSFIKDAAGAGPDTAGIQSAVKTMASVSEETYRASLECIVTFNRIADTERIPGPALIISGENDMNAPAKSMRRMAEKIPGAVYEEIAAVGHFPHLEKPEEFNTALARFLQSN